MATENIDIDYTKYDFKDSTEMYVHLSKNGLSKETVIEISKMKNEPHWMLDFRIRSYEVLLISITVSLESPFLLRWTYISVESLKSYFV